MAKSKNDVVASVVTDQEHEQGEHPIGQLVHISTVTHAWRGVLKSVTASYMILDGQAGVAMVGSCGAVGAYAAKPVTGNEADRYKNGPDLYVNRSAISWMMVFG